MCESEDRQVVCISDRLSLFNAMTAGEASFKQQLSLFRESKLVHSLVNIGNLFKLVLTVPMNTESCERCFSGLSQPKQHGQHHEAGETLGHRRLLCSRTVQLFMGITTTFYNKTHSDKFSGCISCVNGTALDIYSGSQHNWVNYGSLGHVLVEVHQK